MKRFSLVLTVLCSVWFASCNKDEKDGNTPDENSVYSLLDGSIVFNSNPDVTITPLTEFPIGSDDTGLSASGMVAKATNDEPSGSNLRGNDYRFKLVAQVSTLKIDGVEVQATHVKISEDGYAFVSYNEKGEPHRGGVVVYKYTVLGNTLDDITVQLDPVDAFGMPKAEISALDYYNGKLYLAGANSDRNLGYVAREDKYNYAFFMVMEMNTDKTFKKIDPSAIVQLTSFQGTSIRVVNDKIYVTVGDGSDGNGGLYIYDANTYTFLNLISGKDHARSVDTDDAHVYMMQAEPARVSKYDAEGNNEEVIYETRDESMQQYAKSEMLAWDNYLFVAENESGLRMLFKETGEVNASLDRPGENAETEVTNSVCMNSDLKKNGTGKPIQSNLLLLANGEKGIYWYDVVKDNEGKDWIAPCLDNSILGGSGSANFITSRGNIVFLADGKGGLKVLYIGFNNGGEEPPISSTGCDDFMGYLMDKQNPARLFPEEKSVFRLDAAPAVKTMFESVSGAANYVEITNSTDLYITYIHDGADWHNAMGYFVIPARIPKNSDAEYEYYKNEIKPDMCKVVNRKNILKDKYIVFKNITDSEKGGPLTAPNIYRIGNETFNPGDRVVFFIVPYGWSAQNNNVVVSFANTKDDNQVFFTHEGINTKTNVPFHTTFNKYRGLLHNTFYSAECNSMVMIFEDSMDKYTDADFNDIIVSVSDNIHGNKVENFVHPKYTIKTDSGTPELVETNTLSD